MSTPNDICTDPDNCRRCKAPPDQRTGLSHAGVPLFQRPLTATDVDVTLAERGSRYGVFMGHAHVTMDLKRVVRSHLIARDKKLSDDQQEAIDMICHKLGRIINGDPNYADSWVDIAGYAKLISDRLETGVGR